MPLQIIKAEDRLKQKPKTNIAIFGPSGVGKTTLARTLPPKTTFFIDLEAGTLAIAGWKGDVLDVRKQAQAIGWHPWEVARGLACLIGGPEPMTLEEDPYGKAAYEGYKEHLMSPDDLKPYDTCFVDSITVASRMCWDWAAQQPESFAEKTGKPDKRATYGIVGLEMVRWLTHLQAYGDKSLITVGILESKTDQFDRLIWQPQVMGGITARELPGIFDQIATLALLEADGTPYRALVPKFGNEYGFPAKDRSGCLEDLEPPDLSAFIKKIRSGKRLDEVIETALPAEEKK